MKPTTDDIANDPTLIGNDRPRQSEDLPEGEKLQEEDPRNGMNRPVDPAASDDKDEDDEKKPTW